MPKVIKSTEKLEEIAKGVFRKVYNVLLGFDTKGYDAQGVLKDSCRLCYHGKNKQSGIYPNKEEMIRCGECATDIRRKHSLVEPQKGEFEIEIETTRRLGPVESVLSPSKPASTLLEDPSEDLNIKEI